MNPYEPPQTELPSTVGPKKRSLFFIWLMTVIGTGLSLFFWQVPGGGILTAVVWFVGGYHMAKRLHNSTGMIVGMTILYGILIATSCVAIALGVCAVTFSSGNFH